MVDINLYFSGNRLKAADLQGHDIVLVIARVEMEQVGDTSKPVIYFQDKDKGMVLNKTNAHTLEQLFRSPDTDHWLGKQVTLGVTWVDYAGKQVQGLRFRPQLVQPVAQVPNTGATIPAQPQSAPQPAAPLTDASVAQDHNDEIPW